MVATELSSWLKRGHSTAAMNLCVLLNFFTALYFIYLVPDSALLDTECTFLS